MATPVIDFAASASANVDGQGYSHKEDRVPFSLDSPRSPIPGGEGGYTATSATFYGGITPTGTGSINLYEFDASDSTVRFRLSVDSSGDSATAVFIWQKEHFLGEFSESAVTLDEKSAFSVNSRSFGAAVSGTIRFVIESAGEMFISDVARQIPRDFSMVLLEAPTSVDWFTYDPESDLKSIGSASTPLFSEITSLGIYFEISSPVAGQNITLAFDSFQVFVE